MDARVDLVTLGVRDLADARRFYVDGLGWRPVFEVAGEVVFIQVGHGRLLALFGDADLQHDIGARGPSLLERPALAPMSLAQIVPSEADVVAVYEAALAAGATGLKPPQWADFGGFHCYFADPSGFPWEIATNPGWSVAPDGTVHIGPIG